jgi:hypothetical protein
MQNFGLMALCILCTHADDSGSNGGSNSDGNANLELLSPVFTAAGQPLSLMLGGKPWLSVSPPRVYCGPQRGYVQLNLTIGSTLSGHGVDAVGGFTSSAQSWSAVAATAGIPSLAELNVTTVIKVYAGSSSSITFSQVYPDGANFDVDNATIEAIVGFPHFELSAMADAGLRRLAWSGMFSEANLVDASHANVGGVIEQGPLVLFTDPAPERLSDVDAMVVSPMNLFKKVAINAMPAVGESLAPAVRCSAPLVGHDQSGGHMIQRLSSCSREACCAACGENANCNAWVRAPREGTCFLISNATGTRTAVDREACLLTKLPPSSIPGWGYGVTGFVRAYPLGLNLTTIVTAPTLRQAAGNSGVHAALATWGAVMRQAYRTRRESARDLQLNFLGYYTDNGAWFNMNKRLGTSKNDWVLPEAGLKAAAHALAAANVPVKYIMLDDWWYDCDSCSPKPACKCQTGNINCVDGWTPRADWFPSGLAATVAGFNHSASLYQPTFCQGNQFNTTLGVPFTAPYVGGSQCEPLGYQSSFKTYSAMMHKFKGLIRNFEIDFLSANTHIEDFLVSLTANEEWLRGMHDAAAEHELGVQYCMALPSDLLTSLSFPWVVRTLHLAPSPNAFNCSRTHRYERV